LDRPQVPFLGGLEVDEHPRVFLCRLLYFVVANDELSQDLMGSDQFSVFD
jgi:hypothetical protein